MKEYRKIMYDINHKKAKTKKEAGLCEMVTGFIAYNMKWRSM
jgi:hypothetical protein